MSPIRAALLGFVALAGSGCYTAQPSGAGGLDRNHDKQQPASPAERQATSAWEQVRASTPKHSDAYAEGFRAGFVGSAEGTGSSELQSAPPLRYRLAKYSSGDGDQSVNDWRDGFKFGAATARGNGPPKSSPAPSGAPVSIAARASERLVTPFPTNTSARAPERQPPPGPFPSKPPEANRVATQPAIPATLPPREVAPANLGVVAARPKPTEAARVAPPAPPDTQIAAKPTAPRPPVVVVESSRDAVIPASASVPAPETAPAPKDEFSPWQPAKPLRAPTVVRDP